MIEAGSYFALYGRIYVYIKHIFGVSIIGKGTLEKERIKVNMLIRSDEVASTGR